MCKIIYILLLKSEIFMLTINLHYNLKHIPQFYENLIYSFFYGTRLVSYLACNFTDKTPA